MRRTKHVVLPVRSWQYVGLLIVSLACLTLGLVSRDKEGKHGSLAGPEMQHVAPHKVDACPNINPHTAGPLEDFTLEKDNEHFPKPILNEKESSRRIRSSSSRVRGERREFRDLESRSKSFERSVLNRRSSRVVRDDSNRRFIGDNSNRRLVRGQENSRFNRANERRIRQQDARIRFVGDKRSNERRSLMFSERRNRDERDLSRSERIEVRRLKRSVPETEKRSDYRRIARSTDLVRVNKKDDGHLLTMENSVSRLGENRRDVADSDARKRFIRDNRSFVASFAMQKFSSPNILDYETLRQALVIALCAIYGSSMFRGKRSFVENFKAWMKGTVVG